MAFVSYLNRLQLYTEALPLFTNFEFVEVIGGRRLAMTVAEKMFSASAIKTIE
jgi:hypothetical protein